ncbi:hypothetical protein INT47_007607 [Mucor saturninus]|uniref:RCC1-like domain-containing protein n=1 Tax=Mucor saturninus TaxID=64648 RepID=A0A8H7RAR5_9FUNG|nr:hypothetical protein INT47_007607 [Mucor saturninus]
MLKHGIRKVHTQASKTVLYGWGQTLALPLSKGSTDRIFDRPRSLKEEQDYALPTHADVTRVATGWAHSLLAFDNQVYAFGLDQSGQLGGSHATFPDEVKLLACGREHSHVVTENKEGTQLYSFGNNMYGQLGVGKSKRSDPGTLVCERTPQPVHFNHHITDIVCGLDHTVIATQQEEVYAMGWAADGQLGQGFEDKNRPSRLTFPHHVDKLSSSTDFTLALTPGGLWTWGNSEYGQGLQGRIIDRILEPLKIQMDVSDFAAGGPFSVILASDGQVYTCGYGALGLDKVIQTLEPTLVQGLSNKEIIKVFASTDYAAALSKNGDLYTWGLNGSGRLGLGPTDAIVPKRVDIDKQVIDVSLGTNHAIATCAE